MITVRKNQIYKYSNPVIYSCAGGENLPFSQWKCIYYRKNTVIFLKRGKASDLATSVPKKLISFFTADLGCLSISLHTDNKKYTPGTVLWEKWLFEKTANSRENCKSPGYL